MKSLIIFDFDDTLFPTSDFATIRGSKDLIQFKGTFVQLDKIIHDVLHEFMKYGKAVIVTNASHVWIHMICEILPKTKSLLYKKVEVISARDLYSESYPGDMLKWKTLVFETLFKTYFRDSFTLHNVVSIGDAHFEYKALVSLHDLNYHTHTKRVLKTVKFVDKPSNNQVKNQLLELIKASKYIMNGKKHMDLLMINKN